MKIDITRDSFDLGKHFTRVLLQQGRVQLDADWNEQVAILLHYMQALTADLIGPAAGPRGLLGFTITIDRTNPNRPVMAIGQGRYYVAGKLCENERDRLYTEQDGYPLPEDTRLPDPPFLVYLDVWERAITPIEDPGIREVGLNGPDTAARAQLVWQVRVSDQRPSDLGIDKETVLAHWTEWAGLWQPANRGMLMADSSRGGIRDTSPCAISPESRYRGLENQLYRIEIHKGGRDRVATFKWSRENGAVTFPIRTLTVTTDGTTTTTTAYLDQLGYDRRTGLAVGDVVEVVDDLYVLQGRATELLRVDRVDLSTGMVVMLGQPDPDVGRVPDRHPLLRRWDHRPGDTTRGAPRTASDMALEVREGEWLTLEDGVQIFFEPVPVPDDGRAPDPHTYRTGDYWLIPARVATGNVEWPRDSEQNPLPQPPHGVHHDYAPLAIIDLAGGIADCRTAFDPVGQPL